ADAGSLRQKREIRHDVAHLGARGIQRGPVHAAAEAIIDAVLDGFDDAAAGAVLRITRKRPDPRAGLATAGVEVTARTAQAVAHMTRDAVPCRQQDRAPPSYRVTKRSRRNRCVRNRRRTWRRLFRLGAGENADKTSKSGPFPRTHGAR